MKQRIITILLTAAFSIGLFLLGFSFAKCQLDLFPNVKFHESALTGQFTLQFYLGLALALLPVVIVCVWKLVGITRAKTRFLSALVIIFIIVIFIFIRREIVLYKVEQSQPYKSVEIANGHLLTKEVIPNSYPVSEIKLPFFILLGIITGGAAAYFLFRKDTGNIKA